MPEPTVTYTPTRPPVDHPDPLPGYRFRVTIAGQQVAASLAVPVPSAGAVVLEAAVRDGPHLPVVGYVGLVGVTLLTRTGEAAKSWEFTDCRVVVHGVRLDATEARVAVERVVLAGPRVTIRDAAGEQVVDLPGPVPAHELAAALAAVAGVVSPEAGETPGA